MTLRILIVLLILTAAHAVGVAQSPPRVPPRPWNGYEWARIPNNFRSIIDNGGTRIPGSESATASGPVFQLPLAIPEFRFLDEEFTTGTNLVVSPNGYIGFNRSTSPATRRIPYLEYDGTGSSTSYANRVLMAFWGNVQPAGADRGGIYWATTVEEGIPVMIIEWRVRSMDLPSGGAGNFQAKLFRSGKIEIHYGPESLQLITPGSSPSVTGNGAVVGIKNYGQWLPGSGPWYVEPGDRQSFLLMLNPRLVRDTAAISWLRTLDIPSAPGSPEFRADLSSYVTPVAYYRPSPYFHYRFPDSAGNPIGYRIKPMDYDMSPETSHVALLPEKQNRYGVYEMNDLPTIITKLVNRGEIGVSQVPVEATIYRGTKIYDVLRDTVKYIGPFDTLLYRFKQPISPNLVNKPDYYRIRVSTSMKEDPNRENDASETAFTVRGEHDMIAHRLISPVPARPPGIKRYPIGSPVEMVLSVVNGGRSEEKEFTVTTKVFDGKSKVAYTDESRITGRIDTLEPIPVIVPGWTPTTPGLHLMRMAVTVEKDAIQDNDTIWYDYFPMVPIEVVHDHEFAVGTFPLYDHRPLERMEYDMKESIPVSAVLINNGVVHDAVVTAEIKDKEGTVVYNRTIELKSVARIEDLVFPDFKPTAAGKYCITVSCNDPLDLEPSNNSTEWCFNVAGSTVGVPGVDDAAGISLTVRPDPARTEISVGYTTPTPDDTRITIHALDGTTVMTVPQEKRRSGSILIPLNDLPSGIYIVRMTTAGGETITKPLHVVR